MYPADTGTAVDTVPLSRPKYPVSKFLTMLLAFIMAATGLAAMTQSMAVAKTTAYEFTGRWVSQPESVVSGVDVLAAEWRLDINDDAAAAKNDPVPNNVVTVVLENAQFTDIPQVCLTASPDKADSEVNPLSTISADRRTLTCNIGTRNQGTAQLSVTGMLADGPAGSQVGATGTFAGHSVELPKIPVTNSFAMDAKFNDGAPLSYTGGDDQFLAFPFSLSHARNTPKGPDSVSYELEIKHVRGIWNPEVQIRDAGCEANNRVQSGFPFSAAGHPAEQTTRFAKCELTKTGPTSFNLTLSDLDYSAGPVRDSNGQPLPAGMDVITSGNLLLKVEYVSPNGGQVELEAKPITYQAVDGQESTDDAKNNQSRVPIVRGLWLGGWIVAAQRPEAYPGTPWSNTSLAPAGAVVMSVGSVKVPHNPNQSTDNWVCKVLDTNHVSLEKVRVAIKGNVKPSFYYDNSYTGDIWYYTGDWVNPGSNEQVSPNDFECGGKTNPQDPAAGNQPGWSTTAPDDLSTVKAVKVRVPKSLAGEVTTPYSMVYLVIEQRIKADTPIGTDIWTWTTALQEGAYDWAWGEDTSPMRKAYHRTDNPEDTPPYGTKTPGLRFAYAAPGRDVLRTVGSQPLVDKSVAQDEYGPGQEVEYTIKYGLESNLAKPAPDQVVLTDTLPKGMSYVPNSAVIEPEITGTPAEGQILTWTFTDIVPNAPMDTLIFKAKLPADVALGSTHVNTVKAQSQGITREDSAQFVVPNSGYTTLVKQAVQAKVDLDDKGAAEGAWTLTLTSHDPNISKVTDLIDILPYVGDERGTKFSGEMKLLEVKAPADAEVYYTTADPKTLKEDPADAANGSVGLPSDIWKQEFTADATAIRVIAGPLSFGDTQVTTVRVSVTGAENADTYVNSAVGRATSTELRMRTSAFFTVAGEEPPAPEPEPTPDPEPEPTPDPKPTPTPSTTPVKPGKLPKTGV